MIQHAGRLAGEADGRDPLPCRSSAATKKGQKIERYYRDVAMYRTGHISDAVPQFRGACWRRRISAWSWACSRAAGNGFVFRVAENSDQHRKTPKDGAAS